jgi:hypothetical protein
VRCGGTRLEGSPDLFSAICGEVMTAAKSRAFLASASKDEELTKAFTHGRASAVDHVIASEAKQSRWVEDKQAEIASSLRSSQ